MLPEGRRILPAAKGLPRDHRANRFIAALAPDDFEILEPYLEVVDLPRGRLLYDTGDTIRHAYFPHDAIISLVGAMEDGRLVEVALFGREGFCGYLGHLINDEAFGRYVVQIPGSGSRVELRHLHEAKSDRAPPFVSRCSDTATPCSRRRSRRWPATPSIPSRPGAADGFSARATGWIMMPCPSLMSFWPRC